MLIALNILTIASLLFGLFFMFIGALGLVRFPDLYHRMHASSKCITLGIAGMLMAVIFHLAAAPRERAALVASGAVAQTQVSEAQLSSDDPQGSVLGAITKAILVLLFQFVAAPVAAHMLSRAAHMDHAQLWSGTLSDDLATDMAGPCAEIDGAPSAGTAATPNTPATLTTPATVNPPAMPTTPATLTTPPTLTTPTPTAPAQATLTAPATPPSPAAPGDAAGSTA